MNMMSFIYKDKDENDLRDWALNYVKWYTSEIEDSETERVDPFLVINREPDFWFELPEALRLIAENWNIDGCRVGGPYLVDTEWLPENFGHECYVYQNYDRGEVDSGVEYAEGEFKNQTSVRLNEFFGHLKSDTIPEHRLAVGNLSPRQFAGLISYLSQKDESLDITKNNFERGPFILSPSFEHLIEELMDNGTEDSEKIAEEIVESVDDFITELEIATGDDIFCFFFIE
tara:strand:+ start:130 stop:819 length:690 start_codon:yes stop_codon:yes gene_type:complete